MKKIVMLLMALCSMVNVHAYSTENQFVIVIERQQDQYEGNSVLYNFYDSSLNGIKGGCFAAIAVPCTFGLYIPYAFYKFADLCYKKACLMTSNAATFNTYTRQELEREASLRELYNRGAKAFVALLYLMMPLAAAGAAR